ncbi:MAG: ribosome maturation factor RimM [Gammaproteobacteria bacterium]|nr:ribosome maturation factor RimM [Gammaproteobacteria bacterium]
MAAQATKNHGEKRLIVGRVSGLHGVQGWIKVYSYTDPRQNILNYSPWLLKIQGQWQERKLLAGRPHGKGIVAQIEGCVNRDQARELMEVEIAIHRDQLPALEEGEFYWSDLEGLKVSNLDGDELGSVDYLFQTGANDVMVLKGDKERLVPFVQGEYVKEIDLAAGIMIVDWPAEDDED